MMAGGGSGGGEEIGDWGFIKGFLGGFLKGFVMILSTFLLIFFNTILKGIEQMDKENLMIHQNRN